MKIADCDVRPFGTEAFNYIWSFSCTVKTSVSGHPWGREKPPLMGGYKINAVFLCG